MTCCDLHATDHCCAQVGAGAAAGRRRGWRTSAVGHRGLEPAGARLRRHNLPGRRDAAGRHHRAQLPGGHQKRHRHASSGLGTASAALLQLQPVQHTALPQHSKQQSGNSVWLESELYIRDWRRSTRRCGSGCTPRSAWRRSSAGCWASFSAPSCRPTSSRASASTTCTRQAVWLCQNLASSLSLSVVQERGSTNAKLPVPKAPAHTVSSQQCTELLHETSGHAAMHARCLLAGLSSHLC